MAPQDGEAPGTEIGTGTGAGDGTVAPDRRADAAWQNYP
ncbi:hypothetical protein HMPREF9278_0117 [Mobiluncus mulieris FB024-16]|nr:hypothetical protein HMPREF9278_0117 [Mobiluncus mulieris FB024-16]